MGLSFMNNLAKVGGSIMAQNQHVGGKKKKRTRIRILNNWKIILLQLFRMIYPNAVLVYSQGRR